MIYSGVGFDSDWFETGLIKLKVGTDLGIISELPKWRNW